MTGSLVSVLDNWDTWGVFVVLTGVNLVVFYSRTEAGVRWRNRLLRAARRLSGREDLSWLDWRILLAAGALWYGGFAVHALLSGQAACPHGVDLHAELDSGLAFWKGANPVYGVPTCSTAIPVPYGLAAILLDAIGSLGGEAGIYAVWGVVALSVLPLTWAASGSDRRHITLYVATSVLFIPIVTGQYDGATNAIVPVTCLVVLYLGQRRERLSVAVGGVLSTARFPSLIPVLATSGSQGRRGWSSLVGGVATFGGLTGVSYLLWGNHFLNTVFFDQFARRSYSLNIYGILLLHGALPASLAVEGVQAGLPLALFVAVLVFVRSPVRAIAITLVGIVLITPFLSHSFFIWLLPVALVGGRARGWLWGIATVGQLNDWTFNAMAFEGGVLWPAEVLDGVLTVLLLFLFWELWRSELRGERSGGPSGPAGVAPADIQDDAKPDTLPENTGRTGQVRAAGRAPTARRARLRQGGASGRSEPVLGSRAYRSGRTCVRGIGGRRRGSTLGPGSRMLRSDTGSRPDLRSPTLGTAEGAWRLPRAVPLGTHRPFGRWDRDHFPHHSRSAGRGEDHDRQGRGSRAGRGNDRDRPDPGTVGVGRWLGVALSESQPGRRRTGAPVVGAWRPRRVRRELLLEERDRGSPGTPALSERGLHAQGPPRTLRGA